MVDVEINNVRKIYMIGIGGIGMSALARYFLAQGKEVSGYDRVSTRLTDDLIREGSQIRFEVDLPFVRENFPRSDELLVIYTPAIPDEHPELAFFRRGGYTVVKRAEMLGMLTRGAQCIAVAGTHGKTTVSTLMAYMLKTAGMPCNAFLGGISRNLGSNVLITDRKGWYVIEADEYDRSFLNLYPEMAVITACDPDHLDVYGNRKEMLSAYCRFISQITDGGILVQHKDVRLDCPVLRNLEVITYSAGNVNREACMYQAGNIILRNGRYHFDALTPSGMLGDLTLGVPGRFNIENALPAIAISQRLGIKEDFIREALAGFRGVNRRFDLRISRKDLVYIDDYAHHPRELDACIRSVREMCPGRQITGIFQPHLYSRTRDLASDFARSLEQLDEIILLGIYPAREKPIGGITSKTILDLVKKKNKMLIRKEELMQVLEGRVPEVLLTMGAGDIDAFVEPIVELYSVKGDG